ncbi:MAG: hypothetical protein HYX34_03020 [Actinobacteria bacterium]|nr:hypothetical protein [Actinomycetota bacterium]
MPDELALARTIAYGRLGFGAAVTLAPHRALPGMVGRDPGALIGLVRMFGARDAILALGTLRALDRGDHAGGWLLASAAADTADAAQALAFGGDLGRRARLVTLAAAVPAAVIGWRAVAARSR